MDNIFKITAVLGALAWLPYIINWLARCICKPKLIIHGDNEAQVGFIAFGSVLNMNFSFISKNKSSLIEKMELIVSDKDNSTFVLNWAWYGETYYELKAPTATATMGKQQKAIAFLSYKDIMIEKFVGFHSVQFREKRKELISSVNRLIENQKYSGQISINEIKRSNEYIELLRLYDDSLIWRKGDYNAVCNVFIMGQKTPFIYRFHFTLTEMDINDLKNNINLAKIIIEKTYFPDNERIDDNWSWSNPSVEKDS